MGQSQRSTIISIIISHHAQFISAGDIRTYEKGPARPPFMTEKDKVAADVSIDANTHLVLSLDVFNDSEEKCHRVS